jgi:hypothetical protein
MATGLALSALLRKGIPTLFLWWGLAVVVLSAIRMPASWRLLRHFPTALAQEQGRDQSA